MSWNGWKKQKGQIIDKVLWSISLPSFCQLSAIKWQVYKRITVLF